MCIVPKRDLYEDAKKNLIGWKDVKIYETNRESFFMKDGDNSCVVC